MCQWQEIERRKSEMSWKQLTEFFAEASDYAVVVDEAALKKMLSRACHALFEMVL